MTLGYVFVFWLLGLLSPELFQILMLMGVDAMHTCMAFSHYGFPVIWWRNYYKARLTICPSTPGRATTVGLMRSAKIYGGRPESSLLLSVVYSWWEEGCAASQRRLSRVPKEVAPRPKGGCAALGMTFPIAFPLPAFLFSRLLPVGGSACTRCKVCEAGGDRARNHCPERTVLGILGKDGTYAEYLTLPCRNLHVVSEAGGCYLNLQHSKACV